MENPGRGDAHGVFAEGIRHRVEVLAVVGLREIGLHLLEQLAAGAGFNLRQSRRHGAEPDDRDRRKGGSGADHVRSPNGLLCRAGNFRLPR